VTRRIAILSDIHGNLPALEAVLADAAALGCTEIVNLGDILSGPLWPAETAALLMPLGLPTLAGNHERQIGEGADNASDRFAATRIDRATRDWLAALPATLRLDDDVLLVHGTPASDLDYLLETVEPAGARAATQGEVATRLGRADAPVILCGHSHVPRVMRLDDGRLVVNPGSVGLPGFKARNPFPHVAQAGSPHARYGVAENNDRGDWHALIRAVTYDWESAAGKADAEGRPDWSGPLRTGFA
jgi:predicted phosphodiesterase